MSMGGRQGTPAEPISLGEVEPWVCLPGELSRACPRRIVSVGYSDLGAGTVKRRCAGSCFFPYNTEGFYKVT